MEFLIALVACKYTKNELFSWDLQNFSGHHIDEHLGTVTCYLLLDLSQMAFTCSNLTMETPGQCVKSVQS